MAASFSAKKPTTVLLLATLAALCTPAARAQQQQQQQADTSTTRQVEIVAPSDSLVQTTTAGGERRQQLIGNVRLRQGTTRLRADRATRFRGQGEILFVGDVLIIDEGDSLWADRVRYDSRRKVGRATGAVRVSSKGEVLLAGPRGRYFFKEKHAVFPRRVTLVDSARVLKSRSGEYFSRQKRAEFYRRVRVFSDSSYLEADSVTYRRESEVSDARGHVFIERRGDRADTGEREKGGKGERTVPDTAGVAPRPEAATRPGTTQPGTTRRDTTRRDTAARARRPSLLGRPLPVDTTRRALLPDTTARALLWGERAHNDPRAGYSRVTGRALLVRLQPPDSSGADTTGRAPPDSSSAARPDTLIVRARRLETMRSDTLRRLIATDTVRLWQADLQAVADSAVYDQRPEAKRRSAPGARPAGAPSSPDTARADTARADTAASTAPGASRPSRRESRLFGGPLAWSPGGGDGNAGAQLSGDSLRVTGRAGDVRRLYSRGHAFLAQEDSALAGRLQQLKGRRLVGRFARDSTGQTTLRRLRAGPNAEAIYFQKTDDGALGGAVRVSSDSIVFRLRGGALEKMRVLSGVEGQRYKAENVPDPFALDGLVWAPGRRPRKAAFLTEERVRRRLIRPAPPNAPPAEAPPAQEALPAEPPPTTSAGASSSNE